MLKRFLKWGLLVVVAATVVAGAVLLHDIPEPRTPVNGGTIAILDVNGEELAVYGAAGSRAVPLERLPDHLIDAVIAIEDRRFFYHVGVDPIGILRAIFTNLTSGRVVQGGSTLTQQLAKNLYLGPERTMKRKAQEAVLALILELRFSKDEILELYLNRVYLGAGTYGVEAAAQRYFAKPAAQLGLRESALIAGLLKAPSRYDPTRNPAGAEQRMRLVVDAMVDAGKLERGEADRALAAPALPVGRPRDEGIRYATDFARDEVAALIGNPDGDLKVYTTIDARLQNIAAGVLGRKLGNRAEQGAMVIVAPDGAVRAMVGGDDYGRSQYNRAVRSKRQPGSAFKPFFYLAALEAGWTPRDRIEDRPVKVGDWEPRNYRDKYLGTVTLTEALARSANAAAVRLSESVGRTHGVEAARRLGVDSDLPDHPSVVLGTAEVNVLELATAYAPFGNGGLGVTAHMILRIEDERGRTEYERRGDGLGRVIGKDDAGDMSQMLRAVIETGSGQAARLDRQAGGKTGTTQDNRDAWFAGVTADYTAVVWVGRDDNSPMKGVTGSGLPAQIWGEAMMAAHRGLPPRPLPEGTDDGPRISRNQGDDSGGIGGLFDRIKRFLDGDGSGGSGGRRDIPDPTPAPSNRPSFESDSAR
ncbi:MAG: transglycosylase domain-containing protein [Minwuia sp.]|uniref:transglycosylase domain-containing protein n=1 Tax=Minwuia sp. TaxID=2493630 RepID=UPI003A8683A0